MERKHYFTTYWTTYTWKQTSGGSIRTERNYSRQYETEAEAIKKARKADKNPDSHNICVVEKQRWEAPEPAPNGTLHVVVLRYIPWWMD